MIVIVSKKDGFRRCGIAHSKTPVEYPDDKFTAKELKVMKDEPMLVVNVVEGGKETPARPNANDTITLVKAATTIEELNKLAEGEDRKSVLAVIESRHKELSA